MFESRYQRNVLHRVFRLQNSQQITDHCAVNPNIISFRFLPHPGGKKDVRRRNIR
jgi:hypothetical protein